MANEHHEDGIYFGMPEDEYHQDGALGSTSLKKLAGNPAQFWWDSPMNPARPEAAAKDTPAKIEGTATHAIVLEGAAKFHLNYDRGPDHTPDMSPADKSAATKAANKKAAAEGKIPLKAEVFDRLIEAAKTIRRNDYLRSAFSNGEPEVSVFWTRPGGVRLKARFDYLKVKAIGDLKTIANERELPMERACYGAIASYDYLVQAASYLEARGILPALLAAGRVFGNHDRDWLGRVAAESEFAFQWVFLAKTGAPLAFSTVVSPENDLLLKGRGKVDLAVANYQSFMQHYGPDKPWIVETAPMELTVENLPRWYDFE